MDTEYKKLLPLAKEAAMNLYDHLLMMNRNKAIRKVLAEKVNMNDTSNPANDLADNSKDNRFFQRFDNHISLLAVNDAQKCYERLGHAVDLRDEMALPVAIFFSVMIDHELAKYWDNENTAPYEIAEDTYNLVKTCFNVDFDEDKFLLVDLLRDTDVDQSIVDKYATLLYRFALAIGSADQCIDDEEQKWLSQILSFSQAQPVRQEVREIPCSDDGSALTELNSLIGLATVKDEIQRIYNLIKIQKIRETKGMKSSPISYHCVFTGNPGTGKTTVA